MEADLAKDLPENGEEDVPVIAKSYPELLLPASQGKISPAGSRRGDIVKQVSSWVHELNAVQRMGRQISDGPRMGRQISDGPRWSRQVSADGPRVGERMSDETRWGRQISCGPTFNGAVEPSGESGFNTPSTSPCFPRSTGPSRQSSEASQSVILFDWDDTLFPTTELFNEWGFPWQSDEALPPLSEEQNLELQNWQDALNLYLHEACSLSDCVVIVTSSRRPWVETCIDRFAPGLKELFARSHGGPMIIYVEEALTTQEKKLLSQTMDLRPVHYSLQDPDWNREEWEEEFNASNYAAIKSVLTEYYSRYPGRPWNVLSFGDLHYQHGATQEVTFMECKENCYTKTILVPTGPGLSELTLCLRFSRFMLPEYLHFEGNINLDLQREQDPLEAIGLALNIKELATLSISSLVRSRNKMAHEGEIKSAIAELEQYLRNR